MRSHIIYLNYMYNRELALNNLQRLISRKTQPTTPGQSRPRSNGNEGIFHTLQFSVILRTWKAEESTSSNSLLNNKDELTSRHSL